MEKQLDMQLSDELFEIVGCDDAQSEKIARPQTTYLKDAWRRFKQNKVAVGAFIMLVFIVFLTIFGPTLCGYDYAKMSKDMKQWPSAQHWFGTDKLGRDLFARVCVGGRVSMEIGIIGALITTVIGAIYGAMSAYVGGVVDSVMMRIVEIISSIPYMIVVIMLSLCWAARASARSCWRCASSAGVRRRGWCAVRSCSWSEATISSRRARWA